MLHDSICCGELDSEALPVCGQPDEFTTELTSDSGPLA